MFNVSAGQNHEAYKTTEPIEMLLECGLGWIQRRMYYVGPDRPGEEAIWGKTPASPRGSIGNIWRCEPKLFAIGGSGDAAVRCQYCSNLL